MGSICSKSKNIVHVSRNDKKSNQNISQKEDKVQTNENFTKEEEEKKMINSPKNDENEQPKEVVFAKREEKKMFRPMNLDVQNTIRSTIVSNIKSMQMEFAATIAGKIHIGENSSFSSAAILEKLGQGAFGTTFKAIDLKTKTFFALKNLEINDKNPLEEICYEIYMLQKVKDLKIPNIVRYVNSFIKEESKQIKGLKAPITQKIVNIIEEYGPCSLKDIIRLRKKHIIPYKESEILYIISELGETLFQMKKFQIIHQDVKPDNIIVDNSFKHYKFIDFGISQELSLYYDEHGLKIYQLGGSPGYIAPEITNILNFPKKSNKIYNTANLTHTKLIFIV